MQIEIHDHKNKQVFALSTVGLSEGGIQTVEETLSDPDKLREEGVQRLRRNLCYWAGADWDNYADTYWRGVTPKLWAFFEAADWNFTVAKRGDPVGETEHWEIVSAFTKSKLQGPCSMEAN